MSEKISIGKIIASAWFNGITTVINGTEINYIDPPKPDLAIPYKIIAGTTLRKNNKLISIINQKYSNKDKTTNIKTNIMTAM